MIGGVNHSRNSGQIWHRDTETTLRLTALTTMETTQKRTADGQLTFNKIIINKDTMSEKPTMMVGEKEIIFPIVPEGNHLARVFSIVDMGTQSFNYKGNDIDQRKIRIAWELPNETYEYEDKEGNMVKKHHIVAASYTASKGTKAKLRPVLVAMLGEIPKEDMNIFDIMGKTCMVDVIHDVSKKGRPYAKVVSVTKVPKGLKAGEPINEQIMFTWDSFNKEAFEKLPKWVKEEEMKTPEFKNMFGNDVQVGADLPDNIDPDSIPF